MSLIQYNPWDSFEGMDEIFNRLPAFRNMGAMQKGFTPAMDVYETKDSVVVETPLAGVDSKDVEVSVEKGVLTIKGESKKEHEVDDKNYYRKEVRSGSFFRQVALPNAVKEDGVQAEFEDGVLKIICPKVTPTEAKKVQVKIIKKSKNK
ncbi:Hsp20/alpha crystallin family protein [Patescibacteria group bacterium]|nr:Hsp20/alpha crystallin family protein [Patescibacteria group bacterium]MBU1895418.1 Hsp20/alpha crystallin family protein [Patescibacteria group bacterium]